MTYSNTLVTQDLNSENLAKVAGFAKVRIEELDKNVKILTRKYPVAVIGASFGLGCLGYFLMKKVLEKKAT
jgi:hypothetical protein